MVYAQYCFDCKRVRRNETSIEILQLTPQKNPDHIYRLFL